MRIVVLAFFMVPFLLPEQRGPVHVGGMEMSYEIFDDSVAVSLRGPTTGWVGIGFNDENNIVGSDLLLFHVIGDETVGLDMYVQGVGDPQEDILINGQHSIRILEGNEQAGQTRIRFSMALNSQDPNDYKHTLSEPFWLILAYAAVDDFKHHSLMRRHIPFVFESN